MDVRDVIENKDYNEVVNLAEMETNNVDDPIFKTFSVTLFFQGCDKDCKGCHNPQFRDRKLIYSIPLDFIYNYISIRNNLVDSIVFCGGEPLLQEDKVIKIAKKFPGFRKILYTGYGFTSPQNSLSNELLQCIDAVIDGEYKDELKTGGFPASSNQRVYVKNKFDRWKLWKEDIND